MSMTEALKTLNTSRSSRAPMTNAGSPIAGYSVTPRWNCAWGMAGCLISPTRSRSADDSWSRAEVSIETLVMTPMSRESPARIPTNLPTVQRDWFRSCNGEVTSPIFACDPRTETTCPTGCPATDRSEEHTSELQSRSDLVCRLLLEKKKKKYKRTDDKQKNKQIRHKRPPTTQQ